MKHDFAIPGWKAATKKIESGEEASVTFRVPGQPSSQSLHVPAALFDHAGYDTGRMSSAVGALVAGLESPLRPPALSHHRRPLRSHHRTVVVRPRPPLEGDARRASPTCSPAPARSISPPAPATSRLRSPPAALVSPRSTSPTGCCSLPRAKGPRAPPEDVTFVTGDMMALPFQDGAFDLVTTGYGIRNVPAIEPAIAEIRRVLRPGGLLLSLDFDRPASSAGPCRLSRLPDGRRFNAGLGPAPRSGHLSLHSGVDPPLSGSGRRRGDAHPRRVHRESRRPAARWLDGDQRGASTPLTRRNSTTPNCQLPESQSPSSQTTKTANLTSLGVGRWALGVGRLEVAELRIDTVSERQERRELRSAHGSL